MAPPVPLHISKYSQRDSQHCHVVWVIPGTSGLKNHCQTLCWISNLHLEIGSPLDALSISGEVNRISIMSLTSLWFAALCRCQESSFILYMSRSFAVSATRVLKWSPIKGKLCTWVSSLPILSDDHITISTQILAIPLAELVQNHPTINTIEHYK